MYTTSASETEKKSIYKNNVLCYLQQNDIKEILKETNKVNV